MYSATYYDLVEMHNSKKKFNTIKIDRISSKNFRGHGTREIGLQENGNRVIENMTFQESGFSGKWISGKWAGIIRGILF